MRTFYLKVTVIAAALLADRLAFAQMDHSPLQYGTNRMLQSRVLGEKRTLSVRLPPDYEKSKRRFPVLYKLDGGTEGALQSFAEMNYLTDMVGLPEHIVVGVWNTNRGRDMGEGRDAFVRFLETELIPFIDANYRTGRFRVLCGESASAQLAIYSFLRQPTLFDAYVAASFGLHRPKVVTLFDDGLKDPNKFRNAGARYLFVTNGGIDGYDADGKTRKAGERFLDSLKHVVPPTVLLNYRVYEDEGHVPWPSAYHGLRWIYTHPEAIAGAVDSGMTFTPSGQQLNRLAGRGVVLADVNGDGVLDVIVANESSPDGAGVRVYPGDGHGRFEAGAVLANEPAFSSKPAVSDLNGDGAPDVVTGNTVWLNDGHGRFTAQPEAIEQDKRAQLSIVRLADVNGDGHPDLVAIADWSSLRIYLNDGHSGFRDTRQRLGAGMMGALALADVDGNGTIDVVTGGWKSEGSSWCPTRVWLNDGNGTFHDSGQVLDQGNHHVHGIALGDLDGDGRPDLVLAMTAPEAAGRIYHNDGQGHFYNTGQIIGHGWSHNAVLADFDGDGFLDIFLVCGDPATGTPNEVWRNDGHGRFRDSGLRLGAAFSWDADAGDLNGDGRPDVVVANLRVADGSKSPPVFGGEPAEVWLNTRPKATDHVVRE